jgi:hypothetical protein
VTYISQSAFNRGGLPVNHRVKFLKVKLKSLAAESRIIRTEEKRAYTRELHDELHLHRVKDVRGEARATHVAYAFLRGQPASGCEKFPQSLPPQVLQRVLTMIAKYAGETKTNAGWSVALQSWLGEGDHGYFIRTSSVSHFAYAP